MWWPKQQTFISHNSGSLKSGHQQVKSWWGPSAGLQIADVFLWSHMARGARDPYGASFISALISFMRASFSWPHHLLLVHLLIPSHWGLSFQYMTVGEDLNIQFITMIICTFILLIQIVYNDPAFFFVLFCSVILLLILLWSLHVKDCNISIFNFFQNVQSEF